MNDQWLTAILSQHFKPLRTRITRTACAALAIGGTPAPLAATDLIEHETFMVIVRCSKHAITEFQRRAIDLGKLLDERVELIALMGHFCICDQRLYQAIRKLCPHGPFGISGDGCNADHRRGQIKL